MDGARLVAFLAIIFALTGVAATVILSFRVLELQRDLERVVSDIRMMSESLGPNNTEMSLVDCCFETDTQTQCFRDVPVYRGEPAVVVLAMLSDVTIGVRNNSLSILSVGRFPGCGNWSLYVLKTSSTPLKANPLYPLEGGEKLIITCKK